MAKPRRWVSVTTTMTAAEKKALDEIAQEWGLATGTVLRRLILLLLQERISFLEILKRTSNYEQEEREENTHAIRVALSSVEKQQLLNIAKDWDFPITLILRRLIRALTSGEIPKNTLW